MSVNESEFFSKKLKELRESKGMSQSALAEALEISRGSISFYENGERVPDILVLCKVSNFRASKFTKTL